MGSWILAVLGCTPPPPAPADEGDADTDADTDTDTDTDGDTDADGDTDPPTGWRWGGEWTVDDAAASLVGEFRGDWAGGFLTSVGDVDGDGIADLAIGADGSDTYASNGGKVYLVHGHATPWSVGTSLAGAPSLAGSVADQRLQRTEPLGDVNGDGLSDVGVMEGGSAPADEFLMLGSVTRWAADVAATDADVIAHTLVDVSDDDVYQEDPIGDFDGDGRDDWLLTFRRIGGGTAWVLSGAALSGTVDFPGSAVAAHLVGGSLATSSTPVDYEPIGDFTGDGLTDIAVADPAQGYRIVAGSPSPVDASVLDATVASIASADGGAVFVDPLGDVSGDGFTELWSISRGELAMGIALYFGGPANAGELRPDAATIIAAGSNAFGLYDAGDVDGDGHRDLVCFVQGAVSKTGWDMGIVLGRASWPAAVDLDEIVGWIPGVEGGEQPDPTTVRVGDLDGDGRSDLLVTSPTERWNGLDSAGAIRVFRGRAVWPETFDRDDHDAVFVGSHSSQGMGNGPWLAIADLDGDGRDDVVSASYYHPPDEGRGTTFVFFGQPTAP
jgi:hypothetical protein